MNIDILKNLKIAIGSNDEAQLRDNLILIHKDICRSFMVPHASDIQIIPSDSPAFGVYSNQTHKISIKMPLENKPYITYALNFEQEDCLYNLINTVAHETYHHIQSYKGRLIDHNKPVEDVFLLQYKMSILDIIAHEKYHLEYDKIYSVKEFSARKFALKYTKSFYNNAQMKLPSTAKYIDNYLKSCETFYIQNNLVDIDNMAKISKEIIKTKSYNKVVEHKLTSEEIDKYFYNMKQTLNDYHNEILADIVDIKKVLTSKNIPLCEVDKLTDKELFILNRDSNISPTMSKQSIKYANKYIHNDLNKVEKIKIAYTYPKFINHLNINNELEK